MSSSDASRGASPVPSLDPLAAVDNLVAWHDCSLRALGHETRSVPGWWLCPLPAPNIYFTAIARPGSTNGGDAAAAALVDRLRHELRDPSYAYVSVCDSTDALDLRDAGLVRLAVGTWADRAAGPVPVSAGPGSGAGAGQGPDRRVEPVTDAAALVEFERTVVEGFGARFPLEPFAIHAPAILDDPAMHLFLGRDEHGEPVAVSMAYETAAVVGVYGVATIARARGQGWATTLTRAALEVDPTKPAVLQPTPAAWPLYRRLGFRELGRHAHWQPPR